MNQAFSECILYEAKTDATCRGANGRKMRQDCCWCPNYRNWLQKKKEDEKEEKEGNGP